MSRTTAATERETPSPADACPDAGAADALPPASTRLAAHLATRLPDHWAAHMATHWTADWAPDRAPEWTEPTATGEADDAAEPRPDWDCQTCGACCSYSAEWPRFTLETDEALALIPPQFVAADERGMRCEDNRCSALAGKVGEHTACQVYAVRPEVCRDCLPGDHACRTARAAHGIR